MGKRISTDEGIWNMKKATPALLLAGLAVSACLQAQAAEPQANQPQAAVDTGNAVMVGIDAKTGKLRPLTANEAKALAARAAAMPRQNVANAKRAPRTPAEARATMRRHPNGAISMRAPLSSLTTVQAVRAADGSLQVIENDGDSPTAVPQTKEVSE
ncbi:MAG: hypothetical protein QM719_06685 [Thermomonas sp.]